MRIAFLVPAFPNLSMTFIINQITGLIDRGQDVDIYSMMAGDLDKVHEAVKRHGLIERTTYVPRFPRNPVHRLIRAGTILIREGYKNPGLFLKSLNIGRYGHRAYSLRLLYESVPFTTPREYDVIHAQFGPLGITGINLQDIGALRGKLVTHFRGRFDVNAYLKRHGRHVYDELFKKGDLFLANCEHFRSQLIAAGCPPEKTFVHPSGVNVDLFPYHEKAPDPDGEIRILSTGRLHDGKGIEYAVEAVHMLLKKGYNISFRIAGDGEHRPVVEALIQRLGIGHQVHLMGKVKQSELASLLREAHLFVAPSITTADGGEDAPMNVIKEAQLSGLPVVATRHGGIPEAVRDQETGLLVPEKDAAAIADRLEYLIRQPDVWPVFGQAGRRLVEEKYNDEVLNDRLVQIYQSLLIADRREPVRPTRHTSFGTSVLA